MIGGRLSRVRLGPASNGFSNGPAGTARHEVGLDGTERHLAGQESRCRRGRLLATLTSLVSFTSFSKGGGGVSIQSEVEQADAAASALGKGRVVVVPRRGKGEPVEVPESVVRVLAEVLDHARRGEPVRVIADDEEITTQQAADLLNVSRPYLVGLVDRGEIPSRKVGARRRLKLSDVLLYREIDQARRLDAVRALAAEAQELGIY